MRWLSRVVHTQNSGPVARVRSVSGALSQSITAAIPTRVSAFASSGRNAVTVTSCRKPTSPITRTIRSPLFARV